MTQEDFDEVVEARLARIKGTLLAKGEEYARDGDRLHNFKAGAKLLRCTASQCLMGYLAKQLTSLVDLIEDDAKGLPTAEALWDEKLGDSINYLILLEAVAAETRADTD